VKISALTTLHKVAILHHFTIPTNIVDRRNQTLLTSLSPGETISDHIDIVYQYQDWTYKE
jgi:hypothetical protein